jgi:hypothetical protein
MNDPIGAEDRTELADAVSVDEFAAHMMTKLRANKHKAHWSTVDDWWLVARMELEMEELREALSIGNKSAIIKECADVANFAMMIADNQTNQKENQ